MALSAALLDEIRMLEQSARSLQQEMTDPSVKRRLDLVLRDLQEIPVLLDSEAAMFRALILPTARIASVRKVRDTYGPNARLVG